MEYTGNECPVCKQKFRQTDDIVVCPECGTPYHRICYQQVEQCLYKDKHTTGYTWQSTTKQTCKENTKTCPLCFHVNAQNSLFCERCGLAFSDNKSENSKTESKVESDPFTAPIKSLHMIFDPLGGVDPKESIDGIEASAIAKYVKSNTHYYLPIFKNIQYYNKSKFNVSAFLFNGAWFLYRKQYKIGIIFTLLFFCFYTISFFLNYTYTIEIQKEILNSAGISATTVLSLSDHKLFLQHLFHLPLEKILLYYLPDLCRLCNFALMLICGFTANRHYKKHCISRMNNLRIESKTQLEYENRLLEKGGVNIPIACCLAACYFIIQYFFIFLWVG